jgi:hypothetical protein
MRIVEAHPCVSSFRRRSARTDTHLRNRERVNVVSHTEMSTTVVLNDSQQGHLGNLSLVGRRMGCQPLRRLLAPTLGLRHRLRSMVNLVRHYCCVQELPRTFSSNLKISLAATNSSRRSPVRVRGRTFSYARHHCAARRT